MNALDFPFAAPPRAGEPLEVAPGVHWLRMPLPFALDHVNLWLLEDNAAWTAVDTGIAHDPVREAWRKILADKRLARLIVTHFHPDHLGLAAWLAAPLWITPGEYRTARMTIDESDGHSVAGMLDFFRSHGLDAARLDALAARGNAYARGVPALPASFRPLANGETLAIGVHDWQVIVGHGHAPEHASLYCASTGVLISGDMVLPRISTNISIFYAGQTGDPLADFLASLDRLAALPADTLVLPSHGLPFRGLRTRIEQLQAHHAGRCAALVAACTETPRTAAELLPVLFSRDIPDPHQLRFAMGEAIAHLVHLEAVGELRHEATEGVIRFAR